MDCRPFEAVRGGSRRFEAISRHRLQSHLPRTLREEQSSSGGSDGSGEIVSSPERDTKGTAFSMSKMVVDPDRLVEIMINQC